METHAELGYELLRSSASPILELAATIARTHHERYDGSGYPRGLVGEQIPIEGRIVAIVDVFDALTSDRVYRPAFSVERALQMMADDRGAHFDPEIFDVFLACASELKDDRST
jgi:putative two-component system response regulator